MPAWYGVPPSYRRSKAARRARRRQ